ncbi:hypothetical protein P5673_001899 [Acropora cervicornis]|uniref:Uncharacterized protein n=1 Tax=Acropora cervicornis TaxID=6130 RepID=A0AAD9R4F7_ACRCE|nr:hypothetical protein P5673_001899 [Acropora cervicornis]
MGQTGLETASKKCFMEAYVVFSFVLFNVQEAQRKFCQCTSNGCSHKELTIQQVLTQGRPFNNSASKASMTYINDLCPVRLCTGSLVTTKKSLSPDFQYLMYVTRGDQIQHQLQCLLPHFKMKAGQKKYCKHHIQCECNFEVERVSPEAVGEVVFLRDSLDLSPEGLVLGLVGDSVLTVLDSSFPCSVFEPGALDGPDVVIESKGLLVEVVGSAVDAFVVDWEDGVVAGLFGPTGLLIGVPVQVPLPDDISIPLGQRHERPIGATANRQRWLQLPLFTSHGLEDSTMLFYMEGELSKTETTKKRVPVRANIYKPCKRVEN